MHRNLHSPTKLTEFARDFDVEPETFLTKFVNKLTNAYNSSYNSINNPTSQSVTVTAGTDAQPINPSIFSRPASSSSISQQQMFGDQISVITAASNSDTSTSIESSLNNNFSPDPIENRTPHNVMQRISNLMAMKNNNLGSYKNTELQRFWMPDSKSKECYECSTKFSTFRRKHHCRLCGQIFCAKCCNQVVPGKIINCSGT